MRIATIGLDRRTAAALWADYPDAAFVRLPPARPGRLLTRNGPRPDVVVLGPLARRTAHARSGVRRRWDAAVVVVAIRRDRPVADVWRGPDHRRVALAPGFLDPFLPTRSAATADAADRYLRSRSSALS